MNAEQRAYVLELLNTQFVELEEHERFEVARDFGKESKEYSAFLNELLLCKETIESLKEEQ